MSRIDLLSETSADSPRSGDSNGFILGVDRATKKLFTKDASGNIKVYGVETPQEQADWNQSDSSRVDFIKNKPTIPVPPVNADWNSTAGLSRILNKPEINAVSGFFWTGTFELAEPPSSFSLIEFATAAGVEIDVYNDGSAWGAIERLRFAVNASSIWDASSPLALPKAFWSLINPKVGCLIKLQRNTSNTPNTSQIGIYRVTSIIHSTGGYRDFLVELIYGTGTLGSNPGETPESGSILATVIPQPTLNFVYPTDFFDGHRPFFLIPQGPDRNVIAGTGGTTDPHYAPVEGSFASGSTAAATTTGSSLTGVAATLGALTGNLSGVSIINPAGFWTGTGNRIIKLPPGDYTLQFTGTLGTDDKLRMYWRTTQPSAFNNASPLRELVGVAGEFDTVTHLVLEAALYLYFEPYSTSQGGFSLTDFKVTISQNVGALIEENSLFGSRLKDKTVDVEKIFSTVGDYGHFLESHPEGGAQWTAINQVPSDGTTGQVLTKTATGYGWADSS